MKSVSSRTFPTMLTMAVLCLSASPPVQVERGGMTTKDAELITEAAKTLIANEKGSGNSCKEYSEESGVDNLKVIVDIIMDDRLETVEDMKKKHDEMYSKLSAEEKTRLLGKGVYDKTSFGAAFAKNFFDISQRYTELCKSAGMLVCVDGK